MEESFWDGGATTAVPSAPPAPKANETRIVEALEAIASELLSIRQLLGSVTDGGQGWGEPSGAIRTTGR
jgi:hypothetical protein